MAPTELDSALLEIENLEAKLHEAHSIANRADRIIRDLAHRATVGDPIAQAIETELGSFLGEVAQVA